MEISWLKSFSFLYFLPGSGGLALQRSWPWDLAADQVHRHRVKEQAQLRRRRDMGRQERALAKRKGRGQQLAAVLRARLRQRQGAAVLSCREIHPRHRVGAQALEKRLEGETGGDCDAR